MIKLGSTVQDKVTGFKGVVICRGQYLEGCDRYTVQPRIGDDGKMPESETFDEGRLEYTQALEPYVLPESVAADLPGGPRDMPTINAVPER